MAYKTIIYEKKDRIGYITFNRPEILNAMDMEMVSEIGKAIEEIEKDNEVGAVIMTGAGRAFLAGGDINWLLKGTEVPFELYLQHDQIMRLLLRLERLPKPVIAAINGYALGGGAEMITGCDIRIAAENAKIGFPEVTLGIMPGAGGTARLPRLIGKGRALELELTGEPIDAQEAYRIGLVNKVVPEGETVKAAEEMARKILKNAPQAVWQIKNAIQIGVDMSTEGASEYCQKNTMMTLASKDGAEGLRAFTEKRSPRWQGK